MINTNKNDNSYYNDKNKEYNNQNNKELKK